MVFGVLYAQEGTASEPLVAVARDFSPRVQAYSGREVVLDLSGLVRLFGSPRDMAHELRRSAADRGLRVRVAMAATQTAARLLVRHRAGVTVIEPGAEADSLASLPLDTLAALSPTNPPSSAFAPAFGPALRRGGQAIRTSNDLNVPNAPNGPNVPNDLITFSHWGLRTLGAVAALPADELAARLGQSGVWWQRAARGEDPEPLVPSVPDERFEQAFDLEWPIDGLEPLSFVLGRLLEPLSAHLVRRDRGAAVLHVRLHLVTRSLHERSLQLPIPMRDARALRTLILLDLESHPPPAAIDRVVIAVDPTPGRIVQHSLLVRPMPAPEQIATLVARLQALMGETRCGSPAEVDSWEPGVFAMTPFMPVESARRNGLQRHRDTESLDKESGRHVCAPDARPLALRRYRHPVVARVRIDDGHPSRVATDCRELPGGRVATWTGPWRTSGAWWREAALERDTPQRHRDTETFIGESKKSLSASVSLWPVKAGSDAWDREEWDVSLAGGGTYRIFRDRRSDRWFIEGQID
jgi:protein ImuB